MRFRDSRPLAAAFTARRRSRFATDAQAGAAACADTHVAGVPALPLRRLRSPASGVPVPPRGQSATTPPLLGPRGNKTQIPFLFPLLVILNVIFNYKIKFIDMQCI